VTAKVLYIHNTVNNCYDLCILCSQQDTDATIEMQHGYGDIREYKAHTSCVRSVDRDSLAQIIVQKMSSMRGQGMVEFALVLPLLVFMLIGVFEVGWLMRDYIVLLAGSREAARFAVRPQMVDFQGADPMFERVWDHALNSIGNTLPMADKGGMRLTYAHIDVISLCGSGDPNLIEKTFEIGPVIYDDKHIMSEQLPALIESIERNDCSALDRAQPTKIEHGVVVVELFFQHNQLFGFPIISNVWTDPVRVHTYTAMRDISIYSRQ
jgi:hypothetical protein